MSNEQNQVIGIKVETLEILIQQIVRKEMERLLENNRFGSEWKDEILTRKQAADLFGKTPDKISDMYEKKEIPGLKTGREYLFRKSQLVNLFKYKK
jgi:excisionase family DNA binding protein